MTLQHQLLKHRRDREHGKDVVDGAKGSEIIRQVVHYCKRQHASSAPRTSSVKIQSDMLWLEIPTD